MKERRPLNELISLDPHGQGKFSVVPSSSLCGKKDCTILSARISLSYANGSEASPDQGVYIHHLLSFAPVKAVTNAVGLCDVQNPDKNILSKYMPVHIPFSPFTGRGEDGGPVSMVFTSEDGSFNSGYHLGKDNVLIVMSDLVNYKDYSQEVYLTYDYEYVDGFQGDSAMTTLLSVTG